VIISASGNHQIVRIGGRTYNDPIPGGYTTDHAHFNSQRSFWKQKAFAPPVASKAPSIKGEIAVRVQMGTLLDGQKNITIIGVSTIKVLSNFYTLTHHTQNVIDGISNLDPHIGGNELHCCCYNQLQQCWLLWSRGYHVAIQDTTLWGLKILALIAGKDLIGPVKEHDAILDFFMKPHGGKSNGVVFKSGQIDLAIVIDSMDYFLALDEREKVYDLDGNGIALHCKVCTYSMTVCSSMCITYNGP
jgi:hypothetical protein